MAFNAEIDVPKLDWNFAPYLNASGVVPEPTDDEINDMNAALRKVTSGLLGEDFDPTDQKSMARLAAKVTDDQLTEMKTAQIDALTIVTKNSPSKADLASIPPRVRMAFVKWLLGELNDPEGGKAATSA